MPIVAKLVVIVLLALVSGIVQGAAGQYWGREADMAGEGSPAASEALHYMAAGNLGIGLSFAGLVAWITSL